MAVYIVEGGVPLRGTIQVHGAKNAALPVLAAALLPPESRIEGCPRLSDTAAAMNILRSLGCQVQQHPDGSAEVDARPAQGWEIPEPCMREMRSSIIFLGAILTRFGRARVSFPGGCELGPRPIDLHLAALERMGAVIREDHGTLDCTVPMGRLHGAEIVLSFPSVGATQNILIAAVLAEGRTVLHGAAREPEIEDLIRFLNGAGARIRQDPAGTLVVEGVAALHAVQHRVIPDRIAAATYLCCAAAAGGSITVEGCIPAHLTAVLPPLEQAGCRFRIRGDTVSITVPERLGSLGWIRTLPYPGFPTDLQSPLLAVMAEAAGAGSVEETIFSDRFRVAEELNRMGAGIRVEGNTAYVPGGRRLKGAGVLAQELRGGAALVVAGLAADGITVVENRHFIDRGYEGSERSGRTMRRRDTETGE